MGLGCRGLDARPISGLGEDSNLHTIWNPSILPALAALDSPDPQPLAPQNGLGPSQLLGPDPGVVAFELPEPAEV